MHIAVVVDLSLPPWDDDAPSAVEQLAAVLERHPHAPLSFLLPGAAHARLSVDSPGVGTLAARGEFVRTALGSPDPMVVPVPVLERLIQRETDGAARLGFHGNVLATRRPWPLHLLPILARNGVSGLIVPDGTVTKTGVVASLDTVLPVLRSGADGSHGDDLAVRFVALEALEAALESIPIGCATTPGTFLAEHGLVGRAELQFPPTPADPDLDLLRRKTIRLSTRIPERTADEVLDRLATVASILAHPPGDEHRNAAIAEAHRQLIAARRAIDLSRRRGDDWAKATRLDWDADGSEDLQIELPEVSLVLDLAEGGTVLVLDDKQATRPLATLVAGPVGHLLRHQELDGELVAFGSLGVDLIEEGRDRIRAVLSGTVAGGRVECDLVIEGLTLRLRYRLEGVLPGRFGPELALALPAASVRADGGAWQSLDGDPLALEGHRFRITSTDDRTVLVSSLTPAQVFARAATGGLVMWPHWVTPGDGTYEVTANLDA